MINASIAIQVLPDVVSDAEVVRIVDEVIAHIKSYNLKTFVGPFETVVEGDYDTLMQIIKESGLIAIKAGAPSLMSYIKLSYNPNEEILTIDEKTSKYHK